MQFLSKEQTRDWCRSRGVIGDDKESIATHRAPSVNLQFSGHADMNYYGLARQLVAAVQPFETCLLWISQTGIWSSRENLHLYYCLRRANGDWRLIEDAPGHLALGHETAELVSFLFLGLLSGWDMYLFTNEDYGRAFVSHDGWMVVASVNRSAVDELNESFAADG
jgi:hypothetical protein